MILGGLISYFSSSAWRHWGCLTPTIIKKISDPEAIDGFEVLHEDDKIRVATAVEAGHVAPGDIPESARKPEGEEEKPKRARKATKKDEEGEEDDEKPKKSKARSSKVRIVNCFLLVVFL